MQKASGELVKKLKKQKRENDFLLFLDNPKIIKDAISHGHLPKLALVCDEKYENFEFGCETYLTSASVIQSLADTKTPQNVCVMLEYSQDVVIEPPTRNFLVLDAVQDPGNAGTLVRSALASDMQCVFIVEGVSPTNSKLLRSSAGAIFDIPVYSMTRDEFLSFASLHNLSLICTDMQGENIFEFRPKKPVGIVIGNEGRGVSDEIRSVCEGIVSIPMKRGIESLNAGVSGSIIMFQIAKKEK